MAIVFSVLLSSFFCFQEKDNHDGSESAGHSDEASFEERMAGVFWKPEPHFAPHLRSEEALEDGDALDPLPGLR